MVAHLEHQDGQKEQDSSVHFLLLFFFCFTRLLQSWGFLKQAGRKEPQICEVQLAQLLPELATQWRQSATLCLPL